MGFFKYAIKYESKNLAQLQPISILNCRIFFLMNTYTSVRSQVNLAQQQLITKNGMNTFANMKISFPKFTEQWHKLKFISKSEGFYQDY